MNREEALALVRKYGYLNRFETPADSWFVAAPGHHENSFDPEDFIDADIAKGMISDGTVTLDKASMEDSTRCWTYRLLEAGDLATNKAVE